MCGACCDQFTLAHSLQHQRIAADERVYFKPVLERDARGLPGDQRDLPLGDGPSPPCSPSVGKFVRHNLRQPELSLTAVWGHPASECDLRRDPSSSLARRQPGQGMGPTCRGIQLTCQGSLGSSCRAHQLLQRAYRVDSVGVAEAGGTVESRAPLHLNGRDRRGSERWRGSGHAPSSLEHLFEVKPESNQST